MQIMHHLKIHPQFYENVLDGTKTFEIRENDRGFQPGDTVILKEWDPNVEVTHGYVDSRGDYTGRELVCRIGYLLPIDEKRVVFSLLKGAE